MNKSGLFLLIGTIALPLLASCGYRVKSLNHIQPYASFIGKKFVLKDDCYVNRFKGREGTGKPVEITPPGEDLLPTTISTNFIGWENVSSKILGIIRKGSVFTVVGAHRATIPFSLRDYYYVVVFDDPDNAKWGECNTFWISDFKEPPHFN